jgi:acyl carrier protein
MTTTATADDVLAKLQKSYDLVKADVPHRLSLGDDITTDLDLDSLEFIDLVSVLEDEFPTPVIDAVIEKTPDLRTVGELVDAFLAAAS